MLDRWVLTAQNMVQFDIGQLGCGTSLVDQFQSLKVLDNQDLGPATWMPVDVHKSLETIFILEFLKVENHND